MHGSYWCPDLHELYNEDGTHTDKALEVGFPDLFKAVSYYLEPRPTPLYGSLVFMKLPNSKPLGGAFGICLGLKSVFVAQKGIVYLPTKLIERSWYAKSSV